MKNFLLLPGIEFRFLAHPAHRLVILATELSQQEADENWQAERSDNTENGVNVWTMDYTTFLSVA
jgi:hypothetical protein